MKRTISWIIITCLIITSLVLASCSQSTTSKTSTTTTPKTSITSTSSTTSKTTTSTTTNSTTQTTVTATTTAAGHWWDSLGTPQYGGELNFTMSLDVNGFDPYTGTGFINPCGAWMDGLHGDDWTLDPSIFSYQAGWTPSDFVVGYLAKDWEFTDPSTYVVHIRQGIHWQNIAPANGREFTAADVVYHFDRMCGTGDGFTTVDPYYAGSSWQSLISVTAPDKYTVVFGWSTPNPEFIMETIQALGVTQNIECPEAVQLWGNLNDWHHAVGTGPFILTDFVSASSMTLVKNPNYWAYDERHPQNKLPYVDKVNVLIIANTATALAALRTGKIDVQSAVSLNQAQAMQKTNPEIVQLALPGQTPTTVDPRNDIAPFNNINVRIALQEAIDVPTIVKTYYQGFASADPMALESSFITGWSWPYSQWPQDLKDKYAYNPTNAKALLAAAGYANGFNTDCVAATNVDSDLLQIVQAYFAAINIKMDIRQMDPASWNAYVITGHLHDGLGMRIPPSLGLGYPPFMALQRFRLGYRTNYNMVNDPVFNAYYPTAVADTSLADIQQVMLQANQYVAQHFIAVQLATPNNFILEQPWFKGFNGQGMAAMAGDGPAYKFFEYGARFWIDQNLKKSMGH